MTIRLALGLISVISMAWAQPAASGPAFEVATIKEFAPGGGRGPGGRGSTIKGDRFDLPFVNMASLLQYAFRVKDYQISAPTWVHQSMWSISAKLPTAASQDQAPEMMQALLVDRFKLAVHREKRERPVYTLTVAEGGSKLQAASADDAKVWDGSFPGFNFRGPLQSGGPITGRIMPGTACAKRWEFVPLPMAALADFLAQFLNRPVVDQTGMQGSYKVVLEITPEAEAAFMMNMSAARGLPLPGGGGGRKGPDGRAGGDGPRRASNLTPEGCPDIMTLLSEGVGAQDGAMIKAVQQLGLKLQPGKAPIDTVVVDHLETKPTAN